MQSLSIRYTERLAAITFVGSRGDSSVEDDLRVLVGAPRVSNPPTTLTRRAASTSVDGSKAGVRPSAALSANGRTWSGHRPACGRDRGDVQAEASELAERFGVGVVPGLAEVVVDVIRVGAHLTPPSGSKSPASSLNSRTSRTATMRRSRNVRRSCVVPSE